MGNPRLTFTDRLSIEGACIRIRGNTTTAFRTPSAKVPRMASTILDMGRTVDRRKARPATTNRTILSGSPISSGRTGSLSEAVRGLNPGKAKTYCSGGLGDHPFAEASSRWRATRGIIPVAGCASQSPDDGTDTDKVEGFDPWRVSSRLAIRLSPRTAPVT